METVTGIVRTGVMCPLLQGDDGAFYAVADLPDAIRPGDRIILDLTPDIPAGAASCDQGRPVGWSRATRPAKGNRPAQSWSNSTTH